MRRAPSFHKRILPSRSLPMIEYSVEDCRVFCRKAARSPVSSPTSTLMAPPLRDPMDLSLRIKLYPALHHGVAEAIQLFGQASVFEQDGRLQHQQLSHLSSFGGEHAVRKPVLQIKPVAHAGAVFQQLDQVG